MMNHAAFFAALRRRDSGVFGTSLSQQQVDGINGILSAFETHGDGNRSTLAYALATAYHETGRRMVPNRENMTYTTAERIFAVFGPRRIGSVSEARQYVRKPRELANKVYNGMLGNRPGTDDGWSFRGGGQPHLTGRANYEASSEDAGVDLVANPDAMLDPVISARVLIKGLIDGRWNGHGHGVQHYLGQGDWINARRTVNILDKADQIAAYAHAFDAALREAGFDGAWQVIAHVPPATSPRPQPRPDREAALTELARRGQEIDADVPRRGLLAALLRLFGKG